MTKDRDALEEMVCHCGNDLPCKGHTGAEGASTAATEGSEGNRNN